MQYIILPTKVPEHLLNSTFAGLTSILAQCLHEQAGLHGLRKDKRMGVELNKHSGYFCLPEK